MKQRMKRIRIRERKKYYKVLAYKYHDGQKINEYVIGPGDYTNKIFRDKRGKNIMYALILTQ